MLPIKALFGYFQHMARKSSAKRPDAVLLALDSWSKKYGITNNNLLEALVEDIKTQNNQKIWADMDPGVYLPQPESKILIKKLQATNAITGIRNVLVFSPVALTWAAISVVTSAFSEYEQDNPNSIVNFLEFWQQGFGYLNEFWKLSNVAIFDAILVSIVILLTFFINYSTKQNLDYEIKVNSEMQSERAQLILKLNEYFYDFKYPTNAQINKNLFSATKSLEKTLKSINKIVARLEKDIQKYPSSVKLVSELKSLTQEVKKLPKK